MNRTNLVSFSVLAGVVVLGLFLFAPRQQDMSEATSPEGRLVQLEASADLPPSVLENFEILVTQEGRGDKVATAGDTVSVHYTGTLITGTKFDSSFDRGTPFQFSLGTGSVIRGWDLGIVGMKIGEKRRLTIPPELGYGSRGTGGIIPPDATLIFETELIDIL